MARKEEPSMGEGFINGVKSVPAAVWMFLVSQFVFVAMWGVKLDSRVQLLEALVATGRDARYALTDRVYTSEKLLVLIQERQNETLRVNERQTREIEELRRLLGMAPRPPF